MELDEKSAFKYGFLRRCVEEGCDPDEVARRLDAGLGGLAKHAGVADAAKSLLAAGVAIPTVLAAGTGAGIGWGLAKLRDPSIDPDEVRRGELIQAYDTQAQLARIRSLTDKYRPAPRPGYARF